MCFIQSIQACNTKIGRPKEIAGICQPQKNSGNFAKPKNNSKIFQHRKKKIMKFQTQKIGRA